jgi:hypothetical protein
MRHSVRLVGSLRRRGGPSAPGRDTRIGLNPLGEPETYPVDGVVHPANKPGVPSAGPARPADRRNRQRGAP